MFKNFITLEDFQNKTVNDKLIENFDYFSANLICLFIRKLDLNLYLRNLDLEEVISKYDVNISIHSNFNLYNKLNTDYEMTVDILSINGEPKLNLLVDNGIPIDYGLHEIAQSLTSYIHFLSSITNTEFNKNIKLDLYKAYDLYKELNEQFSFNKQIADDNLSDIIFNAQQFVFDFQNLFTTKVYLLLLNEYGYDLRLSLKNQTVFQITDNMIEHPNKSDIKKNELYQLAETLSFRLANNYECSLFSVNNNIENKLKGIFLDDIIIFKTSLENRTLTSLLIKENNISDKIKKNRI